jgi:hypothetical protein
MQQDSRVVRISNAVLEALRQHAMPAEAPDMTLRRILGIAPRVSRRGWPKGKPRKPRMAESA